MTQPPKHQQPQDQPQQPQQPPQNPGPRGQEKAVPMQADSPASSPAGEESGTFRDGSTQAQQDQLKKAAEEANAEVKKYADAERKAREDATG